MILLKELPHDKTKGGPAGYKAEFKCDACGKVVVRQLQNGKRQNSCGCQSRARAPGKLHGMSKTRIYRIWQDMNLRCSQPTNTAYKWYGAKGIRVCSSWSRDNSYGFENFYKDMFNTYFDTGTIDRKNSTGNYEKDNCRWLTQSENTRRSSKGRIMSEQQKLDIGKRNTKYFEEDMLKILEFLKAGGTTLEAEIEFKIPRNSINRGFKKYNLTKPNNKIIRTPSKELLDKVKEIKILIDSGLSITKACNQIGIARQTYRKHKDKI